MSGANVMLNDGQQNRLPRNQQGKSTEIMSTHRDLLCTICTVSLVVVLYPMFVYVLCSYNLPCTASSIISPYILGSPSQNIFMPMAQNC